MAVNKIYGWDDVKFICLLILCSVSTLSFSKTLSDLSARSVFRAFYPNMFNPSIDDEYEGSDLQKAGVREGDQEYLILMSEPEKYKNSDKEDRYLVMTEKLEISNKEYQFINGNFVETGRSISYGIGNSCHACEPEVDLFIFKMNEDSSYELVSKTPKGFKGNGQYGRASFNISDIGARIVKTGKNEVGFFDDSLSYMSNGVSDTSLILVRLNEKKIDAYFIDNVAGTNSMAYGDSPMTYEFSATWKTVNNSSEAYPIELKFSGDTYDSDTNRYVDYKKIKTYEYSVVDDKYILVNERNY